MLALAALLPAQAKSTGEAQPDPMAIVSAAQRELQRPDKDVEAAILMLWQALDLLADRPSNAILEATTLSARYLLQQHDPREAERRRVFTQVAKLQVELATAYRGRKWFESAKSRLDVADSYDKEVGAKERAALLAALPKPAANAPAVAKPEPKSALGPALQRAKVGCSRWPRASGSRPAKPATRRARSGSARSHGRSEARPPAAAGPPFHFALPEA